MNRETRIPSDLADRPDWAIQVVLARRALGLSQEQLAILAGVYQSQLSRYEGLVAFRVGQGVGAAMLMAMGPACTVSCV